MATVLSSSKRSAPSSTAAAPPSGAAANLPVFKTVAGQADAPPSVVVDRPISIVGRRGSAHVTLGAPQISKLHALLLRDGRRVVVRDLASTNGIEVNGSGVREAELHDADEVRIGAYTFRCESGFSDPLLNGNGNGNGNGHGAAADAPPAELRMDGQTFRVKRGRRTLLIGQRAGCDVQLKDPSVAPVHAVVFELDGRRYVQTFTGPDAARVNGRPVQHAELAEGDELRVGNVALRYAVTPREEAAVPAPAPAPAAPSKTARAPARSAVPAPAASPPAAEPTAASADLERVEIAAHVLDGEIELELEPLPEVVELSDSSIRPALEDVGEPDEQPIAAADRAPRAQPALVPALVADAPPVAPQVIAADAEPLPEVRAIEIAEEPAVSMDAPTIRLATPQAPSQVTRRNEPPPPPPSEAPSEARDNDDGAAAAARLDAAADALNADAIALDFVVDDELSDITPFDLGPVEVEGDLPSLVDPALDESAGAAINWTAPAEPALPPAEVEDDVLAALVTPAEDADLGATLDEDDRSAGDDKHGTNGHSLNATFDEDDDLIALASPGERSLRTSILDDDDAADVPAPLEARMPLDAPDEPRAAERVAPTEPLSSQAPAIERPIAAPRDDAPLAVEPAVAPEAEDQPAAVHALAPGQAAKLAELAERAGLSAVPSAPAPAPAADPTALADDVPTVGQIAGLVREVLAHTRALEVAWARFSASQGGAPVVDPQQAADTTLP